MLQDVKIIPYHDEDPHWCGYRLQLPESVKIGRGFFETRIYATIGEAQIAQGLLSLRYSETMDYNEFQHLLEAMLRLAFSTKTWSNE